MQIWNVEFSEELYQQAKNYFLWLGRSDFLLKSKLSLCGRCCISEKMRELWFVDFVPEDRIYQCWIYTYAISHSHEQLFFAVDEQNVTVDVEWMIPRDEGLLVWISDFWLGLEIWEVFYLQWTAKECIVKYLNLLAEDMNRMKIESIKVQEDKSIKIGEYEIEVDYLWKKYSVSSWFENWYCFWIMYWKQSGN